MDEGMWEGERGRDRCPGRGDTRCYSQVLLSHDFPKMVDACLEMHRSRGGPFVYMDQIPCVEYQSIN